MYIYIMAERGIIGSFKHKVGVSKNPVKRLGQLQTGNPDGVKLLSSIKVRGERRAYRIEETVHDWLQFANIKNEWFLLFPGAHIPLAVLIRAVRFITW